MWIGLRTGFLWEILKQNGRNLSNWNARPSVHCSRWTKPAAGYTTMFTTVPHMQVLINGLMCHLQCKTWGTATHLGLFKWIDHTNCEHVYYCFTLVHFDNIDLIIWQQIISSRGLSFSSIASENVPYDRTDLKNIPVHAVCLWESTDTAVLSSWDVSRDSRAVHGRQNDRSHELKQGDWSDP